MSREKALIMTPGPTNVPSRIMKAMLRPVINHRGPKFHELYKRILENLKYIFQTENEVYALTASGTGGVECAISNVISHGDRVIVPVNGVFSKRLKETVAAYGGVPIEIPIEWGKAVTHGEIEKKLSEEKDVKAVAIVYNETSTGVTVRDLKKISESTREHGVLYILDAISILGGDELPVDEWNVDLCVTGSQKCLACPPGLSLVSVSEGTWKAIEDAKSRTHTYYLDLLKYRNYKQRWETPFTPALPLFTALDEALKMIKEEGLENRIKRHKKCAKAFYEAIGAMGLELFADKNFLSNTVIAVHNPPNVDDKTICDVMSKKYGVVIAGGLGKLKGQIFRIGSMGIVSANEVIKTITALENTLFETGYKVKKGEGIAKARETLSLP